MLRQRVTAEYYIAAAAIIYHSQHRLSNDREVIECIVMYRCNRLRTLSSENPSNSIHLLLLLLLLMLDVTHVRTGNLR